MTHDFGQDIDFFAPASARRLTLAAAIGAASLLVFLTAGVGQDRSAPQPVRPDASTTQAQAAHCSQFVELARAKYGAEWKRRLDPRDTVCAQHVQAAWERDWTPRAAAPPPQTAATTKAPAVEPKVVARKPQPQPAEIVPVNAAPARAELYSLAALKAQTQTPPARRTLPVKSAPKIEPPPVTKGGTAFDDGYDGERARAARSSSAADVAHDRSEATIDSAQSARRKRTDDEVLRPRDNFGPAYADDDRDAYPHDDDAEYERDAYPDDDEDFDDSGYYEDDGDWR